MNQHDADSARLVAKIIPATTGAPIRRAPPSRPSGELAAQRICPLPSPATSEASRSLEKEKAQADQLTARLKLANTLHLKKERQRLASPEPATSLPALPDVLSAVERTP